MYTLSVKDHFDAAHFICGYVGPCAKMHGHTWTVELVFRSGKLDRLGMVVDFKVIKTALKKVLAKLDHDVINSVMQLSIDDLEHNPTAEHIAKYIWDEIQPTAPVELQSVIVWESPNAWAAYSEGE